MLDILLKAPINPISIIVYQQLQQQQHHQHHHCHHHHPAVISPVLFFVFPPLLFGVHPTAHGCFSKWTPMAHELFILKSSKFGWFRASLVCWNPYRNVILKSSVIMFSCCRTHGWQYCAVKAHRLVSMLTLAPPPCLADSEESEVTHDPKSSQSLPQEIGFTRGKNIKKWFAGDGFDLWSMMIDGSDIIFGDQEILPDLQWMITIWNSKSTDHFWVSIARLFQYAPHLYNIKFNA